MQTYRHSDDKPGELNRVIRDRIKWDKRVSLADIDVVVRGEKVIVTGYVDSAYKKNAALEVIADTEGVWAIEDHIVVPSDYYRADDEIHKILKNQIDDIIKIGGEHIEIQVTDGVVKLEGEVFRPRLKAVAVSSAWELSGVKDVLNFIDIVDPPNNINRNRELGIPEFEEAPKKEPLVQEEF